MPGNKRGGGGRYYNHGYGNHNHRNQHQQQQQSKMNPSPSPKKSAPPSGSSNVASVKSEAQKVPAPEVPLPPQTGLDMEPPTPAPAEKKFTQRSRLFVGNMPLDVTEQQFKDLFSKYGEISETFVNASKGFGFVRLDTRANAEKAKLELDGHLIKNRPLRVRFASHGAALSLKHLSPFVSNELLEQAFTQFGPVERAVVIVDDRGRATGRGIVEFARKSSATKALQQIKDGCFLLTSSPRAVVVRPLEQEDTEDGLGEKNVPKSQQYFQEREAPPRFAQPGTFEYEFAMRWKALDEMERQQQEQLNKTIATAREKLESEMENAIHDHKTMLMKQDLMRRQEELNRLEDQRKRELDRRKQLEFAREDQHKKELEQMAKRQEVLRAQVEGTFHNVGGLEQSGRNPQRQSAFGAGGPSEAAMQEAIALELMAQGQGGLGPAPTTKTSHSWKNCPLNPTNMRRILGNSKMIRKEERFYQLMFQSGDTHKRTAHNKKDGSTDYQPYKTLQNCTDVGTCQTMNQWKFQILTSKLNRMFAQRSLNKPKLVLYFLPIGPFPDFVHDFRDKNSGRELFQLMGDFLGSFFPGSKIVHLPEINISEIAPRNRHHHVTGKLQYLVSDILIFLQKKLPRDGFAIVGLSWHDMYPCDNLNFILGQGSYHHSACISSFGRFDPNYVRGFKGREDGILPEEMKDIEEIDADVLWKLMKVLSHETCHVFGLGHCAVFDCLMNSSSSTHEALSQPLYLCPLCLSKIQNLQESLIMPEPGEETAKGHFSSLLNFLCSTFKSGANDELSDHKFSDSILWLQRMVEYLGA